MNELLEIDAMKWWILTALLVVCLSPAACAGSGAGADAPTPAAPLEGTEWRLVEVYGKPVTVADENRRPYLLFSAQEHRLSGSGGCNRLTGSYRAVDGSLEFGPMGMTDMACSEGMDIEARFLKALGETRTYAIAGSRLTFYDAGRAVAVFEAP